MAAVVKVRGCRPMKMARRASAAENELFVDPKTSMVFGGTKQSLVIQDMEVKAALPRHADAASER
jgi:hypothetical protein